MDYTQVLIKPLINEKVTFPREEAGQVAFFVHKDANKIEIKKAVETAFQVKVEAVNVVVKKPRKRTFTRIRKRYVGWVEGHKKAYITLAPGRKIALFEGV